MTDPLRVLIVDDEPLARLRLAQLVAEVGRSCEPAAVVLAELANGEAALAWIAREAADVVLLDIQMPGLNGTALAARLRALQRPPAVVFVTAHAEHAVQAFELEALDYLTKPVRRDRLQAALQRAARRAEAGAGDGGDGAAVIVVSERGRLVRVPLAEVLYFKAELKYVTLRTARHSYVLDDALTDLEQRLGERFVRVHRNAIVARSAIGALEKRAADDEGDEGGEGWAVCIAPTGEWLAVSRRQAGAVREALASGGL